MHQPVADGTRCAARHAARARQRTAGGRGTPLRVTAAGTCLGLGAGAGPAAVVGEAQAVAARLGVDHPVGVEVEEVGAVLLVVRLAAPVGLALHAGRGGGARAGRGTHAWAEMQ